MEAQQVRAHGGYVITNETATWGLDCDRMASRHQCFASVANSPYICKDVKKSCKRMGNGTYIFGLIASCDIPPFTEILVNYGPAYIFPSQYY